MRVTGMPAGPAGRRYVVEADLSDPLELAAVDLQQAVVRCDCPVRWVLL